MGFVWEDDQEEALEFTNEILEDQKIVRVSCNADNPGCTKPGVKEIKLCWDIMDNVVYNGRVFLWNNKEYDLSECTKCGNYYIMEEMKNDFICEDCR